MNNKIKYRITTKTFILKASSNIVQNDGELVLPRGIEGIEKDIIIVVKFFV